MIYRVYMIRINLNPMKTILALVVAAITLISCGNNTNKTEPKEQILPIAGTWQLISGTLIKKKDTVVTDYTKDQKAIKIINDNHFYFLIHNLTKGQDPKPNFNA